MPKDDKLISIFDRNNKKMRENIMKSMNSKKSKYNESGINKHTYDLIFSDYHNIPKEERMPINNSYTITLIQSYTKFREKGIFNRLLKLVFEKKHKVDFSKIKFNEETKEYEYKFNGEVYTFDKLSNKIENKDIKKELESQKRCRQCHLKSIELATAQPKAYILTAYVKRFEGKFLHSIVEIEKKKEKYIIDYTKNLIMPKKQYVELTSFEEIERISDLEYLEVVQKINNIPNIELKVFLTFEKEIIKELEKNFFILKKDEELEKSLDRIRKEKLENRKNVQNQKEVEDKERE